MVEGNCDEAYEIRTKKLTCVCCNPGEPAGIGPDIAIELCQIERKAIVLVADKNMLSERADLLGKELDILEDDKQ